MNLGKVEFEKQLKIKNGVAYAHIEATNNFEKIDGCEYFAKLTAENKKIEAEIESLKKQLEMLELDKEQNKSQMLNLESAGYCPLDEQVFTRVGGVVVNTTLSHRKNCKHKGV